MPPPAIALRPQSPGSLSSPRNGLTWVHVDSPTTLEAELLAERFGWHALDVEDVLSKRQRPKIDEYPEYLFVVLHFPVYDKRIQRLNAAELDIFLGPDFLVTLPNVELLPVTRLFGRCEDDEALREQLFSKGSGYLLYHVLDDLFDYCFPILDKIGHKLDASRTRCSRAAPRRSCATSPTSSRRSSRYRKIIKPERSTLRLLERHVERFLPEELELYFDDIVDAAERIWDLLDNYKEVVEALEGTNESIISHRQNDVLRVLTVFSVILLPLTLITGHLRDERAFPGFEDGRGRSGSIVGDHGRRRARAGRRSSATSAGGEVEQLWAPWRLEYIRSADEDAGLRLLHGARAAATRSRSSCTAASSRSCS